jgi:hypothetical protein
MITPSSHKDFIYTGPSWAVQSFSTPDGRLDKETVNIGHMFANEFGLSVEWCPRMGVSNTGLCETIRRLELPQHIPIVWIYCDPIGKIYYNKEQHQMTWPCYVSKYETWVEQFLISEHWKQKRRELANTELDEMNQLGHPIALLGSHSDIHQHQIDSFNNLTLIQDSWQKLLTQEIGVEPFKDYMGVDFLHQTIRIFLKDKEIFDHIKKNKLNKFKWEKNTATRILMGLLYNREKTVSDKINSNLVDVIHETYALWDKIQEYNLWNGVHPNIEGNKIFYEKVKYKLKGFIDDNT